MEVLDEHLQKKDVKLLNRCLVKWKKFMLRCKAEKSYQRKLVAKVLSPKRFLFISFSNALTWDKKCWRWNMYCVINENTRMRTFTSKTVLCRVERGRVANDRLWSWFARTVPWKGICWRSEKYSREEFWLSFPCVLVTFRARDYRSEFRDLATEL